jgi:uncharacterized SAM-binding protein YcdF (DUF218 family)
MYVYLSKILPLLVMPVFVAILLLLAALVLLRLDLRKSAKVVLWFTIVMLWVTSTPIVANQLYGWIESTYPVRPLGGIPESDCIVVLGGAVGPPMPPRVDVELNEAVDRIYKAAQLHRAGKARVVIVTAGNQPWSASRWSEAELVRGLLVEWGVPEDAIVIEGSSRNTRENALYSKNVVDAYLCDQTLLVTSAAHMPRSVAAFASVGVDVIPVPTDIRVAKTAGVTFMDFLPSAEALEMTSAALREWIGRWYYEFKGWN